MVEEQLAAPGLAEVEAAVARRDLLAAADQPLGPHLNQTITCRRGLASLYNSYRYCQV